MKSIVIQNLVIGNEGRRVAGPLNAEFMPGQLSCLLGRNGVGKSTLLRTLSGFQPPMEGSILIDGRPLAELSRGERAKLISIVLTGRPQLNNLTATELVGMGRSPYTGFFGRLRESDRKAVMEALNDVGIAALAERNVATLSDGEMQKVMMAKALAQHTPVMLLDEPTAFLDFPSKVEVIATLSRLAEEQQKIIILSTHDIELSLRARAQLYSFGDVLVEVSREEVKGAVDKLIASSSELL